MLASGKGWGQIPLGGTKASGRELGADPPGRHRGFREGVVGAGAKIDCKVHFATSHPSEAKKPSSAYLPPFPVCKHTVARTLKKRLALGPNVGYLWGNPESKPFCWSATVHGAKQGAFASARSTARVYKDLHASARLQRRVAGVAAPSAKGRLTCECTRSRRKTKMRSPDPEDR